MVRVHSRLWSGVRAVYRNSFEYCCIVNIPWVRIPPTPSQINKRSLMDKVLGFGPNYAGSNPVACYSRFEA